MNENTTDTTTTTDATTTATDTAAATASLSRWLEMWNTDGDIARLICSDTFRIHFANSEPDGSNPGDDVRGADAFATYLDGYHAAHAGTVFSAVVSAVDGRHGRLIWNVQAGEVNIGGVDVLDFTADGLIDEVWSVGGTRTLSA